MSPNPKDIIFSEEAREKLAQGIQKLCRTVAFTLGPVARNVGLEKSWGAPEITNDGNQIINEIELSDDYENMGVAIAKEVAEKMKNKCGDGTTTSTILLNSLITHGIKNIVAGASPAEIKRGIEKSTEAVIQEIDKQSKQIQNEVETLNIATVSASGDENTGNFIAKAFQKVGKNGVLTIEEAQGTETNIEIVEGMQFDRGYLSAYFCSDTEKMLVNMQNPKILLVDKKISSIQELLPCLQQTLPTGKELLIIAEDIEADALATLVINRLQGSLKIAAVKAPGFGDRRKEILEDIACLTGATVVSEDVGLSLKEVTDQMLGSAEKVKIEKEKTTLINGQGNKSVISTRIQQIEGEISRSTSTYDTEKLEERKAKLMGGVAVIRVGACTEPELKQKKQVFQDSLNATKAALEEGIVIGGGIALLRASSCLDQIKVHGDEKVGVDIVRLACQAPVRQIIENVGESASVVLSQLIKEKSDMGFNALNLKIEHMFEAGIVDPSKVVKNALSHAASAAIMVLITEAAMTNAKEKSQQ